MKYEFHVGDYVELKDGRYGYITEIFCSFMIVIVYTVMILTASANMILLIRTKVRLSL